MSTIKPQLRLPGAALILFVISITSCEKESDFDYGVCTDGRDGQKYGTLIIGDQEWFAENLNYYTSNSLYYENDSLKYGEKHGRLYNLKLDSNLCPTGWHLPSDAEWTALINHFPESEAGRKLIDGGSTGFNAVLGGTRRLSSITWYYEDLGYVGYY